MNRRSLAKKIHSGVTILLILSFLRPAPVMAQDFVPIPSSYITWAQAFSEALLTNNVLRDYFISKGLQRYGGVYLGTLIDKMFQNKDGDIWSLLRGTSHHSLWYVLASLPFYGPPKSFSDLVGVITFGVVRALVQERPDIIKKQFSRLLKHQSMSEFTPTLGINFGPDKKNAQLSIFIENNKLKVVGSPWAFNHKEYFKIKNIITSSSHELIFTMEGAFFELDANPTVTIKLDPSMDVSKIKKIEDIKDRLTVSVDKDIPNGGFYYNPNGRLSDGRDYANSDFFATLGINFYAKNTDKVGEFSIFIRDGRIEVIASPHLNPTVKSHKEYFIKKSLVRKGPGQVQFKLTKEFGKSVDDTIVTITVDPNFDMFDKSVEELQGHVTVQINNESITHGDIYVNDNGRLRNGKEYASQSIVAKYLNRALIIALSENPNASTQEILIKMGKIFAGMMAWPAFIVGKSFAATGMLDVSSMFTLFTDARSAFTLAGFTVGGIVGQQLFDKAVAALAMTYTNTLVKAAELTNNQHLLAKYFSEYKSYLPPSEGGGGGGYESSPIRNKCATTISFLLDHSLATKGIHGSDWKTFTDSINVIQGISASHPFAFVLLSLSGVVGGAVFSYKYSSTFRNFVDGYYNAIYSFFVSEEDPTINELVENRNPTPNFYSDNENMLAPNYVEQTQSAVLNDMAFFITDTLIKEQEELFSPVVNSIDAAPSIEALITTLKSELTFRKVDQQAIDELTTYIRDNSDALEEAKEIANDGIQTIISILVNAQIVELGDTNHE